jgi:diaminopimelate epimerase
MQVRFQGPEVTGLRSARYEMIQFFKYHGLGNDFILVDNRENTISSEPEFVRKLCHRNFGIGADGLILAENSSVGDIRMIIINSDGSRAEMCGNGLRCFSKFAYEKLNIKKGSIDVETDAGVLTVKLKLSNNVVDTVKVNMGKPVFDYLKIPCTIEKSPIANEFINISGKDFYINSLLLGVPHTVVFTGTIDDGTVIRDGKIIENSNYFPHKTNVNFVKVVSRNEIVLRTWERGAGYTYACGTGACASVVAGIHNGILENEVLVHLRGGDLKVSWYKDDYVYMEGPSEKVYEGCIN